MTPQAKAILDWLRAHPEGATSGDLQTGERFGAAGTVKKTIQRMALDGMVRWVAEVGSISHRRRYYHPDHAPAKSVFGRHGHPAQVVPRARKVKSTYVPGEPIITICPSGEDTRFRADPETMERFFSAGKSLDDDTALARAYRLR